MFEVARMWLAGVLSKLSSVQVAEVIPEILPPMERCRLMFKTIDFSVFRKYKQSNSHGRTITVVHANIESCIADLAAHITTLENSGYILQSRVEYNAITIPLAKFFISKDGYYLESLYNTLLTLQDTVLGLCKAIDEAKHVEYDTRPYNLRMLNALFHVLLDLGTSLDEIGKSL